MFRHYLRFQYFPTPTNTGCDTDVAPVKFDECNPLFALSEVKRIFIAKAIAAPFTDWTSEEEWLERLSNTATSGDDYIRTLTVRGNKPAPTGVTKDLTNFRKANLTKNHVLNFLIDEVWIENHELVRQNEVAGKYLMWYETHGGFMFGGNSGIKCYMALDMVLNEGPEEIMTYNGQFTWSKKITEERCDSPIFDLDNAGTSTVFDTILIFTAGDSIDESGVTATIGAIDPVVQFQFDQKSPLIGSPKSMTIELNAVEVMTVDFPDDYIGESFRYVDADGEKHYGSFKHGTVSF